MSDVARKAAQAAIELEATNAILEDMRAAAIEKWAATGAEQVNTREKLYVTVAVIGAVRKALNASIAAGKVERHGAEMARLLEPDLRDRR